jgi:tetratricopeptide (TPR) repeat protein
MGPGDPENPSLARGIVMTPPDESKLYSFDLRLAQWDEARAADTTPSNGQDSSHARWQAVRNVLDQLEQALSLKSLIPGPESGSGGVPFGRFVLGQELGRGGFGVVFLADDPQLGRSVALKIPRPEFVLDDDRRQRFLHEARAAGGLDHPNIVAVHEAGEVGPVAYLAMAFCPGASLAAWLKENRGPVPPTEAAVLVVALADAMQHAHARGVLHRDLKPANVLLQRTENGEQMTEEGPAGLSTVLCPLSSLSPKVTDFGLARRLDDPGQTQTGAVLGTPAYMAPEQAAGRTRDIGTHTDIYALGAILYQLLTGRPPFEGTSAELLHRVQLDQPASLRRVRPKPPRDLETICLKCLAKEPAGRYASASALADDLRHWRAGEPIVARPASSLRSAWLWARRKPALAVSFGLFVFAVIAGITGTTWGFARARAQLAQRESADHVDSLITLGLADIDKGRCRHALATGEECRKKMQVLVDSNPESAWFKRNLAVCLGLIGDGWRGLDQPDRAMEFYEQARVIYKELVDVAPDSVQVLEMQIDNLNRLISTSFLIPGSIDVFLRYAEERVAINRRRAASIRRTSGVIAFLFANFIEMGDICLLECRPADAARYYERAKRFAEETDFNEAPAAEHDLRRRAALCERAAKPGFNAVAELLGYDCVEFMIRQQHEFAAQNDYQRLAAVSQRLTTINSDFRITFAAARGFAQAADLAPPGDDRRHYSGRCEQLVARLLTFSDEASDRVRNDPLLARYLLVPSTAK